MDHLLIVGAKSDIARAVAAEFARNGFDLTLAARNADGLEDFARDLKIRYKRKVAVKELDVLDLQPMKPFTPPWPPGPRWCSRLWAISVTRNGRSRILSRHAGSSTPTIPGW